MTIAPVLVGSAVTLRPPCPTDVAERLALGQSPEVYRMFGVSAAGLAPLSEQRVADWLADIAASPTAWVIDHQGRLLGDLWLRHVNAEDRNARLALGLYDSSALGQGLGRAAIRTVFPYAFEVLGLHRLSLRVLAFNTRAIRCYRACGFVEEGRERESAWLDGQWEDDVIMGCLATEAIG